MQPSSHITPAPLPIRHCGHHDIDPAKWDACVSGAHNRLIYGRSFYLEYMTGGQWEALIAGDYEYVMPLTWKKKWGIRYCYQPPFTQQTGIFSAHPVTTTIIHQFLTALTQRFSFAEIFFNFNNPHPAFTSAVNLILPLHNSYETLYAQYKKDLIKNLKEASRSAFQYHAASQDQTLALYRQLYQDRTPHVQAIDYSRFEQLCKYCNEKGNAMVRGVSDSQGQLLATALLLQEAERVYLLQSATPPAGRRTAANHFLLDAIIRELAGKPLILDFEGSDIPGIAHFYRNFGATDQPYYFFRHNRLPWPLRLFK